MATLMRNSRTGCWALSYRPPAEIRDDPAALRADMEQADYVLGTPLSVLLKECADGVLAIRREQ